MIYPLTPIALGIHELPAGTAIPLPQQPMFVQLYREALLGVAAVPGTWGYAGERVLHVRGGTGPRGIGRG